MINYRTYQPVAQDAGHYREILLRGGSKLPGRGDRWECRFNPYRPERVWLYDHTADTWVTCDFRLRHLLHDPWTADMWQEHAEQHRAAGGSEQDEAAITLALAQRDRRRRSRRPPPKRTGAEPPFQGLELETEQPSRDPYAGLEEFDLSTLHPYPALPISPWLPRPQPPRRRCPPARATWSGPRTADRLRIRWQRSSPTTATAARRMPPRPAHRQLSTRSSRRNSSTTSIRTAMTVTRPKTTYGRYRRPRTGTVTTQPQAGPENGQVLRSGAGMRAWVWAGP